MTSARFGWACVVSAVWLVACAKDHGGGDASVEDARAPRSDADDACGSDDACDDGLFCNGAESCDAGVCVAGEAPCATGTCEESSDTCRCTTDADRDGARSSACGGDDCDDTDPGRYPGATEICDPTGRDEDCDATTLGPDRDGDGFPSDTCCQRTDAGALVCGTDCDDARMGVGPGNLEACNGFDDDCNGVIDDGVLATFYRDLDGDGFGITTSTTEACSAPIGYAVLGGDCDDTRAGINPGQNDGPASACDTVDNDCDSTVDEGCDCVEGSMRRCGPTDASGVPLTQGICRQGQQTCIAGAWGGCTGAVEPAVETCNTLDDDCDGTVDEALRVSCYRDGDDDTYALAGTAATSVCRDPARAGRGQCPVQYTNRAPAGASDCNDGNAAQNPGQTELCGNGVDDNCSGLSEEGCACSGCGCSGVLRYAVQTELSVSDRQGYVDYAGYRFEWQPPDAMGNARMTIRCASNPARVYASSYALPTGDAPPLIVTDNQHELWLRDVGHNGVGTTFTVFITRY